MVSEHSPLLLRVWMLVTRCFALPITALSWVLHRRMGADPTRFAERLGHGGMHSDKSVIWFHAASLGEVKQIASLADHLMRMENAQILVTTTTASGADWVAKNMPDVTHRFAPLDTPKATERFLAAWSISAAIFVEGDLWPRLLRGLHRRVVPRILLNARHSRSRARFPAVFAALLLPFSLVTCRSATVEKDLTALGLAAEQVHVLPDLRLTQPKLSVADETLTHLSEVIGHRPLWLAASTHEPDEEAVLAAHLDVLETHPDAMLIIAPRHPHRGAALQKLAQSKTLRTARRSPGEGVTPATQVYIADTLGELGVFFTLCPITFLGGSFGREGGHNPYEPIHFDTALVAGPEVKNFADAYATLHAVGAAMEVLTPAQLGPAITDLLDNKKAAAIAQAGLTFSAGTEDCTLSYAALIKDTLRRKSA